MLKTEVATGKTVCTRLSAAAGAAMVLMSTIGVAQAELVTVRFTGEINYVYGGYVLDPFGVPDVNGQLATPLSYVYQLTFDTSVGTYSQVPGTDFLHSVPQNNPANRSWSLTINGITDAGSFSAGDFYNSQIMRMGSAGNGSWSLGYDGGRNREEYFAAQVNANSSTANSSTFSDPFVNQNTSGIASFHHYAVNSGGIYTSLYILSGTVTGVDVLGDEQVAAVPEPATWATMLLGFLGIGGLMRARRRRAERTASA